MHFSSHAFCPLRIHSCCISLASNQAHAWCVCVCLCVCVRVRACVCVCVCVCVSAHVLVRAYTCGNAYLCPPLTFGSMCTSMIVMYPSVRMCTEVCAHVGSLKRAFMSMNVHYHAHIACSTLPGVSNQPSAEMIGWGHAGRKHQKRPWPRPCPGLLHEEGQTDGIVHSKGLCRKCSTGTAHAF